MARPKKDYTTSVNHGKNKTRSDERAAFKGTKDKARTPSRKYKKATEDAKHAFLMQTGYNKQRSNYDKSHCAIKRGDAQVADNY